MAQLKTEIEEIDITECWELLQTQKVGRLAVVVEGRPEIFPINYSLDASQAIIVRTALGTKLEAAVNRPVAFEVDQVDPGLAEGWSVIVHGTAHQTERVVEGDQPLDTWREDVPYLLRIAAASVTGRRIRRYALDEDGAKNHFEG